MFVRLHSKPSESVDQQADPIAMLLACHQRIRDHLRLAQRLVDAVEPKAQEVADAASALLRYFGTALPLHILDEDETLCSALSEPWLPETCAVALAQMRDEHLVIEPVIEEALVGWRRLVSEPLELAALRDGLQLLTLRLGALLEAHLDAEERLIFPVASQVLTADTKARLSEAMRARRQSG
jgi:hemerythrin-like domain-containing protein